MSVVRYGNVFDGRGNVVLFFLNQKSTGMLSIPDPRMTKFWLTLEHGIDFVLSGLERMVGGELFVPKLRTMNIRDLAKASVQLKNVHGKSVPEDFGNNSKTNSRWLTIEKRREMIEAL